MNWLFLEFSVGYFQITFDWGPLIWQQTKLWMGGEGDCNFKMNIFGLKCDHH